MSKADQHLIFIDITSLIGMAITSKTPNGMSRVTLAYVKQYAHQARAMVFFYGRPLFFSKNISAKIFHLLVYGGSFLPIKLCIQLTRALVHFLPNYRYQGAILIKIDDLNLSRKSYFKTIATNSSLSGTNLA